NQTKPGSRSLRLRSHLVYIEVMVAILKYRPKRSITGSTVQLPLWPLLRRFIALACIAGAGALSVVQARAEALLLIEAESGKVLHAENATVPWYPASVTKLMTAYATLRAVKERRITLDTLLNVSPNAVAQQPSKMGFKVGTQVTVDNAMKMLMVKSANDM